MIERITLNNAVSDYIKQTNKINKAVLNAASFKATTIPAINSKVISSINQKEVNAVKENSNAVSKLARFANNTVTVATRTGNPITLSHSTEWLFIYSLKSSSLGEKPTPFALVAIAKDGRPHGSIHVNLIRCSNCGFMWLKFPKYQLEDLKIDHD